MDSKVTDLHEWILGHSEVNPSVVREKVINLHAEIEDEESRVALIAIYCAVTDSALRVLEGRGGDLQPLKDARQADMKMFCIVEAVGPAGSADSVKLNYVARREITAGRMAEDSFAELARNGAEVLGKKGKPKRSLFQKIFG